MYDANISTIGTIQSFQPKLVLTIDALDGIPLNLGLSEDTRRSLENLVQQKQQDIRIKEVDDEVWSIESFESQADSWQSETDEARPACTSSGASENEICKKRRFVTEDQSLL